MANNYGLGRGLASLIPQKRKTIPSGGLQQPNEEEKKIVEPKEDFNYFGASQNIGNVAAAIKNKSTSGSPFGNDGIKKTNGAENGIQEVEIIKIIPNPHQPRLSFNDEKLKPVK